MKHRKGNLLCRSGGIIIYDITMIDFMEKECGIPETVSCRFNPGGVFEVCNGIMQSGRVKIWNDLRPDYRGI